MADIIQFPTEKTKDATAQPTAHYAIVFTHFTDGLRICRIEGIEDYKQQSKQVINDVSELLLMLRHMAREK